ncbi:MAG: UDP-4-amino-4,6-dideoxy-N-acetyl-beta-L-altrosamine N-acetyltransferase, partial [Bacteroidetes bacterium]
MVNTVSFQKPQAARLATDPAHLHKSYTLGGGVSAVNYTDLTRAEALDVLRWRNHPEIRKWMFNPNEISEAEHFRFLEQLPKQNKRFYWVIKEADNPIGVIDIVDYHGITSEWGFYLNPDQFGTGLSVHLLVHGLDFLFKTLGFNDLYGYCHYKNIKALLFHDLFCINHYGYQKLLIGGREDWFSHRKISSDNWFQQNATVETVKARVERFRQADGLETKKIILDQIFIEVFDRPPHHFYRTQKIDKLNNYPRQLQQLTDRIQQE